MHLFNLTFQFIINHLGKISKKPLGCTKLEIWNCIKGFNDYFQLASPLVTKIAHGCYYNHSKSLSLLFLPFTIQNGFLHLTECNVSAVCEFIFDDIIDKDSLLKIKKLVCLKWCSAFEKPDLMTVNKLLSKLTNLEELILGSCVNDAVLAYVAEYCQNLKVIDCSEDSWCEATDTGLRSLHPLKNLRYVLFSTLYDEYEDDKDKMCFTSEGVASLMQSLPELINFECPEYILRDALLILSKSSICLPTVKALFLEGYEAHAHTFLTANNVCPNVETLSIMAHKGEESDTACALEKFHKLNHLKLNKVMSNMDALGFNSFGAKLMILEIRKDIFTVEDIQLLNLTCISIKVLSLFDQCRFNESLASQDWLMRSDAPLFPSLEVLVYRLRDIHGLNMFMHKESSLKVLYARVGISLEIIDVFQQLKPNTYWPCLERIVIPDFACPTALLLNIIESLPSLRYLNVWLVDPSLIKQFLFTHDLRIKLGDYVDDEPFPPKNLTAHLNL